MVLPNLEHEKTKDINYKICIRINQTTRLVQNASPRLKSVGNTHKLQIMQVGLLVVGKIRNIFKLYILYDLYSIK